MAVTSLLLQNGDGLSHVEEGYSVYELLSDVLHPVENVTMLQPYKDRLYKIHKTRLALDGLFFQYSSVCTGKLIIIIIMCLV